MKLTRPALVVAAAAAVLIALPATAASAQTVLHLDQTHDVRSLDINSSGETFTRQPKISEGDVQAIAVNHARHNVTVTVKYRELSKTGTDGGHSFLFRTNTGERREVEIATGKGLWWGRTEMATPRGDAVHCSGMSHTIDYAKNKVILVVPRSCLGKPRWVQVAEATFRMEDTSTGTTSGGTTSSDSPTFYADDAFSSYVGNNLHWSPRVHRG
jgi:hypothetical protein